jgi:hypothetical protein
MLLCSNWVRFAKWLLEFFAVSRLGVGPVSTDSSVQVASVKLAPGLP